MKERQQLMSERDAQQQAALDAESLRAEQSSALEERAGLEQYVYVYVCMNIYIYIYIYIYICICICIYVYIYIYIHINTYLSLSIYIYIYIYIYNIIYTNRTPAEEQQALLEAQRQEVQRSYFSYYIMFFIYIYIYTYIYIS